MSILSRIYEAFWSEWFWLPKGTRWEVFEKEPPPGQWFTRPRDIATVPFAAAACLVLIRFLFERYIGNPLGAWFNLRDRRPTAPPHNPVLEDAFRRKVSLANGNNKMLSSQSGMSTRQVERWFRQRKNQKSLSKRRKFSETLWRFAFYCCIFLFGLYALWDEPFFWDLKQSYYNYPKPITRDLYWYYMTELGFYWSLVFSLFWDNKRKDFTMQIVHHVSTILLMSMSYTCGMFRLGSLVLFVHDICDCWMEAAKLGKYTGWKNFCDFCFVVFTLLWMLTRILYFPLRVIYSSIWDMDAILGLYPAYNVMNTMLVVLQVLHVIWFGMILRIAYHALFSGKVDDERSDSDDVDSSLCEDGDEDKEK